MTARRLALIEFHPDEDWIEIVGHPAYLISTHGRVYSTITLRLMHRFLAHHGRGPQSATLSTTIQSHGRATSIGLAYHVLLAFPGLPDSRQWVPLYLDGDRGNVALTNLQWQPQPRAGQSPDHMREIAKLGFAASPVAQGNVGRIENFYRGRGAR
jgi:hypothetical protein